MDEFIERLYNNEFDEFLKENNIKLLPKQDVLNKLEEIINYKKLTA